MAGDVGVAERVISGLRAEGAPSSEPVLHEYGPRFRIGMGTTPSAEGLDGPAVETTAFDVSEMLGWDAYELRRSQDYAAAKQVRPRAGQNWGGGEPLHRETDATGHIPVPPRTSAEAPLPPTSSRLSGRVAVGLIMVSGSAPGLTLTPAEQVKIVAEIQNGLTWLGAQSPARDVTWVHETQSVTVNVPGVTDGGSYEAFEAPWRDAALEKLGLGRGRPGLQAYVQGLRTRLRTDWAYCVLFTRYPLFHFAYADPGGPHLVMHYENDGWGPDNIDRVFAHETGHIFGAPDEYQASGCKCTGSFGFFHKPNINCEGCAPGGGTDCIMRANTWAMCAQTPLHLGFNGLATS